ncbi:MAG: glycosyltransferase family 9 protein [Pseudomonadota bacterium]|nr:glycosyltransferase family 9 protein [Pseudomonadota bacterium]
MKTRTLKFLDSLLGETIRLLPKRKRKTSRSSSTICVKLSAMGDALYLSQVLSAFREEGAFTDISLLTTSRISPDLFKELNWMNIIVMPTSPLKMIFFLLCNWNMFRRVNMVLLDQYYYFSEFLSYLSHQSYGFATGRLGHLFDLTVPYNSHVNERENFYNLLKAHFQETGIASSLNLKKIYESKKVFEGISNVDNEIVKSEKRILLIYPGSSTNADMRRWKFSNFLTVAKHFDASSDVFFIGGPDELEMKDLLSENHLQHMDQIANFTLGELAYIFSSVTRETVFLGNDAGLLHLAEVQGVRSVSLFGPNLSERWGSMRPGSKCIHKPLSCRPCIQTVHGIIPSSCSRGDNMCMKMISVRDVIEAVNGVFSGNAF